MTTQSTAAGKRYSGDGDSIPEWIMLHRREVTWALVAVAVIVGGIWYYERSRTIKSQNAETAYFQARQAEASGSLPVAVTDLQKVVVRYAGTQAGTQAALTLAQILYQQGKFNEGISVLKKAERTAPKDFRSSVHVLEAGGYEELKNLAAAADEYVMAAKVSRFPLDKSEYRAAAAGDYAAAGKTSDAIAIWTDLAKDETGPASAEARVRLGELSAKPAST